MQSYSVPATSRITAMHIIIHQFKHANSTDMSASKIRNIDWSGVVCDRHVMLSRDWSGVVCDRHVMLSRDPQKSWVIRDISSGSDRVLSDRYLRSFYLCVALGYAIINTFYYTCSFSFGKLTWSIICVN